MFGTQNGTPLATHSVARTTDLAEAARSVSSVLNPHDLAAHDGGVDLVHNVLRLDHVRLHYIDYGGAVTVRPQARTGPFYLVQIPLGGNMEVREHNRSIACSVGSAIGSLVGASDSPMRYTTGCPRLLVQVPLPYLRQRHAILAPATLADEMWLPKFMRIETHAGVGRSWLNALRWILEDEQDPGGMLQAQRAGGYLESTIVDGLLLAGALTQQGAPEEAMPKIVSSAVAYIREHLADPLTPEQVADSIHVSIRSLQTSFRRHLGTTPSAFVRDARLDRIHETLRTSNLGARSGNSVSSAAHQWGVTHLGRFAHDYRNRFGTSPSETLRNRPLSLIHS